MSKERQVQREPRREPRVSFGAKLLMTGLLSLSASNFMNVIFKDRVVVSDEGATEDRSAGNRARNLTEGSLKGVGIVLFTFGLAELRAPSKKKKRTSAKYS